MDHAERARELFLQGYNCAQAVLCAFCDVTGLPMDEAARLASSFGGGIGRLREFCGALSGAEMVLGLARGYAVPDSAAKKIHYERVRALAARFTDAEGTFTCRELLLRAGLAEAAVPGGAPEERTAEFYAKRPCPRLVFLAARITEETLAETEAADGR